MLSSERRMERHHGPLVTLRRGASSKNKTAPHPRLRLNVALMSHGESDGPPVTNAVLKRVMELFMWSIVHLNDRVLELTLGSRLAIRAIFAVMSRQFVPSAAEGFEGWICYELRRHGGAIIEGWALRIAASAANASFGFPTDSAVTLKLTVGDFVRFNLGAVSPVTLLTEERLKLDGDLTVAAKLAPMFGRPLPPA
jgi:SCP-2 sterol transfer family